jgi:hypothetical protein
MALIVKFLHGPEYPGCEDTASSSIYADVTSIHLPDAKEGATAVLWVREPVKTAIVPGFCEDRRNVDITGPVYVMNEQGKTISVFRPQRSTQGERGPGRNNLSAEAAEKDKERQRWLSAARRSTASTRSSSRLRGHAQRAKQFALLWSNIQTLAPAVYARTPIPVVSRRFKDNDPVGRVCSEILERALSFSTEEADFASTMLGCRDEFLLFAHGPGLGPLRPALHERSRPARRCTWRPAPPTAARSPTIPRPTTWWTGKRSSPTASTTTTSCTTRPEAGKRCAGSPGEPSSPAPSSWSGSARSRQGRPAGLVPRRQGQEQRRREPEEGRVYEVWDKTTKRVRWFSKGYTAAPLDDRPDPLKLKGFFPCPKPLFGTLAPDSLVPIPDYMYWQDQASRSTCSPRASTADRRAEGPGLLLGGREGQPQRLLSSDNNTLIPVDSWAALGDKGGLKGIIEWMPLDLIAAR